MDALQIDDDGDIGLSSSMRSESLGSGASRPSPLHTASTLSYGRTREGSTHTSQQELLINDRTPKAEGSSSCFMTAGAELATGGDSGPGISRPRLNSSLSRSRSLNLRIPSTDSTSPKAISAHPSTQARPTFAPLSPTRSKAQPVSARHGPLVSDETAAKMGRWVKEIVVCNFDLERGPVVHRRVGSRRWGPGEKENVAFSSFPDTSLFAEGSIPFSFKIRHIALDEETLNLPEPGSPSPGAGFDAEPPDRVRSVSERKRDRERSEGEKAEEYRKWDGRGRQWLYGFVWFEQKRDGEIKRGYMQKSLVILTHLPFPALFTAVLDRLAPSYFEHGESALEAACHSIASWPDPIPDATLGLPLMSNILNVKLPDVSEAPQIGRAFPPIQPNDHSQTILASLPPSTPLRAFASFLPFLWSLWECLLLAEPILVIAPDPKTCSEIVWWLRDLLRPFTPVGDFRPYLHIHDHDFSLLVNSNKPQAGVVVGVTNPFFRNAAAHWPNVISISADRPRSGVPEAPDGFISKRHRHISKDRVLLKRLETLVAAGRFDDPEGNDALRTYFQQLTERMLVPLNRYFQTLIPPANDPTGKIKPFSLPAFLEHLKTKGPNPLAFKTKGLTSKARVEADFYSSFCMRGCFAGWLAGRVQSASAAVAASTMGEESSRASSSRDSVDSSWCGQRRASDGAVF